MSHLDDARRELQFGAEPLNLDHARAHAAVAQAEALERIHDQLAILIEVLIEDRTEPPTEAIGEPLVVDDTSHVGFSPEANR